jgi:Fe-S cluster assembly iron-binding protein IscA
LTLAFAAHNYRGDAVAIGASARVEKIMAIDVTVSERAALRISEILRQEPAGTMLRVSVEGGG